MSTQVVNNYNLRIDKVEIEAKDLDDVRDIVEFFDRIQQVTRTRGG